MLKKTCIYIVMLFPFFTFAQTEDASETSKPRITFHEIGINSSTILSQFIKLNNETIPQSAYMLTYKYGFGKNAVRFGAGFNLSKNTRFLDGTSDKVTDTNSGLDVRLGYEHRVSLGKRWIGTLGADVIFRSVLDELVSDTSFDRVTFRQTAEGVGGGLVMGIQFRLTKRLMLGTEGAFYYLALDNKREEIYETSIQFNTDPEVSNDRKIESILPSTIYLIFHF